jgi:hypothetical protein
LTSGGKNRTGERTDTQGLLERARHGSAAADFDLGFRGYSAGPVSYQNQVTQQPDGTVVFGFVHSRTPFFMYTMGFQFRYNAARP